VKYLDKRRFAPLVEKGRQPEGDREGPSAHKIPKVVPSGL